MIGTEQKIKKLKETISSLYSEIKEIEIMLFIDIEIPVLFPYFTNSSNK